MKVKNSIIKIVKICRSKFVLKPKFVDAKTLGISIKIENGLTIPPVK